MKKQLNYIILIIALQIGVSATAQRTIKPTMHEIICWSEVGYGRLEHKIEETKVLGGLTGSIGIGYELTFPSLFFINIGIEANGLSSNLKRNDFLDQREMLDTDGLMNGTAWYDSVLFNTQFHSYKEQNRTVYLYLPVQFGLKFEHFYGAIGMKVGLPLIGNYKTTTLINTWGDYNWFIDDFVHMPNHYYDVNIMRKQKGKLNFMPSFAVIAEIGSYITPTRWKEVELRLGTFFSYGLKSINEANTPKPLLEYKPHPTEFHLNSILSTKSAVKKTVTPIEVGLKLTLVMPFSKKARKHCRCES